MDRTFEELVHQYERDKAIHDCENVIGRLFYYTATFMTDEILPLWAERDDSTLEFPFGCYDGIKGVTRFYHDVMGDRSDPVTYEEIKGVMNISTLDTEVIEVAGDRQTARGMWFSPGMETYGRSARFEQFVGRGFWAWYKVYADFILENGVWKIWHLRYFLVFRTDYHQSWTETGDYKGYVLKEPACDRGPSEPVSQYDINAFMKAGPAAPVPYHSFAEVAPGYGYII